MPRKKKQSKEGIFTYKIKVVPVFSPSQWEKGEWVKNKKSIGGYEFTGVEIREQLGHQVVVHAYCNDENLGICETIPNGYRTEKKIHATENEAWNYFEQYKKIHFSDGSLDVGGTFKPFIDRFKAGEIVE